MKLKISHKTSYHYNGPVPYGLQKIRLFPKTRSSQKPLSWEMEIGGGRKEVEFEDHHHNTVWLVRMDEGCEEIIIHATGEVETTDTHGIVGQHGGYAPLWYFLTETALTRPGPLIRALIRPLRKVDDTLAALHTLSQLIREEVAYDIGHTHVATTGEGAMELKRGVCQDHSHIFLSAARLLGIPARYVSGYLMLNDRVEQDATHAWVEAHVEKIGWIGFDVSNGISPDERYVAVATGLDYPQTAPVSGMRFGNTDESLIVSLQVQQ